MAQTSSYQDAYYPPPDTNSVYALNSNNNTNSDQWEHFACPEDANFDGVKLQEAIQFSIDHEIAYSHAGGDMEAFLESGGMHGVAEPEGLRYL